MFGLADCNNFFVSCERTVRPELVGCPVVVLSNNDGCVVARSNEAKRMGVKMGQPAFELRDEIRSGRLIALSGNHLLYKRISIRVHSIFARYAPATIDYSVDEAFLDMAGIPTGMLREIGENMVAECMRMVGIPVTVGFAPTKTLAKVCTELCKKGGRSVGVMESGEQIRAALERLDISDIWGIGRRLARRLYLDGVATAAQFADKDLLWVRSRFGVNGERSWRELHGEPCIALEHVGRAMQESISESRTFPIDVNDYNYLRTRAVMYTEHCARKLRGMKGACRSLTLFLRTNRFRENQPLLTPSASVEFVNPTFDTHLMVAAAVACLDRIYSPDLMYKRGGVIISEISPAQYVQQSLFEEPLPEKRGLSPKLLEVIDRLNSGDVAIMPLASEMTSHHPKSNDGYSSSFQFRGQ